jgi:hypothetical protein
MSIPIFLGKYVHGIYSTSKYDPKYCFNCVKWSTLGQRQTWSFNTGDLLKEVQFPWNFLW